MDRSPATRSRARAVLGGVVAAGVMTAAVVGQTVGVRRDRLGPLGPVMSACLVTVRPHEEVRWAAQVPATALADLDQQLRAHRSPLVGGGRSLPTVQLLVEDATGRRSSFFGSSAELHPGGRLPAAIADLVRQIEAGDTRLWSPAPGVHESPGVGPGASRTGRHVVPGRGAVPGG